jgi:hypothetical protein
MEMLVGTVVTGALLAIRATPTRTHQHSAFRRSPSTFSCVGACICTVLEACTEPPASCRELPCPCRRPASCSQPLTRISCRVLQCPSAVALSGSGANCLTPSHSRQITRWT